MAGLLGKAVATTRELERWLDVTGGWTEATAQIDVNADPTATFRIMGALLLRKARLHTVAVLGANETNNLHSLAVQTRPVLECAGQIVSIFHNLMIVPPEQAPTLVGDYLNADYYGTMIAATKGQIGHKELLKQMSDATERAAALAGAPKPKRRKRGSLRQSDKVAMLIGGTKWYNHLSEYFCHGRADWTGYSLRGGVVTMDTAEDVLTFASLMDYLTEQVAVMNTHVTLCPIAGNEQRAEETLAQLREVRETSKTTRNAAISTFTDRTPKK